MRALSLGRSSNSLAARLARINRACGPSGAGAKPGLQFLQAFPRHTSVSHNQLFWQEHRVLQYPNWSDSSPSRL